MIDTHRDYGVALRFGCPYCGVDPGHKCVNNFGDIQPVPHYSRTPDPVPAPPVARNKRRGSENRQRQKQRCVRLTQAELDTLVTAAKGQQKTLATFLRDAGLRQALTKEDDHDTRS